MAARIRQKVAPKNRTIWIFQRKACKSQLRWLGVAQAQGYIHWDNQTDTPEKTVSKTPRAWQRMLSGRRLDLLDPTPVDIEIEDIAHGLAFVARWNGQTNGDFAYSVAEHSILVTEIFTRMMPTAPIKWQLAALLHDAPEYVIGDMISPVKSAVGPEYVALDERLTAAIHIRFGLPAALPASVKRQIKKADRISAWMEATQIAGFSETEANKIFGIPNVELTKDFKILLRPPMQVRADFTEKHHALMAQF